MPSGRFLDRDLSTNRQYWSMTSACRNFLDLLILWLDAEGRMDGDAKIIRGMVCPLSDWTTDEVEQMLKTFESLKRNNGLCWIARYQSNGIYCLWASGFEGHQKGLQKDHEAKGKYGYSNIPPPPQKLYKIAEQEAKPQPSEPTEQQPSIAEPKLSSMVTYYEQAFGVTITPTIFETLKLLCDEHDETEYQRAVDQAKGRNVRSPAPYIEKCLENWKKESQPGENPEAEGDWK